MKPYVVEIYDANGILKTTYNDTVSVIPVNRGGTGANLSATGGTGQFLKQSSSGANITVAAVSAADIASPSNTLIQTNGEGIKKRYIAGTPEIKIVIDESDRNYFRLSLSATNPNPDTYNAPLASSTLYLLPLNGAGIISLYDSTETAYIPRYFSSVSLNTGSPAPIPYSAADIFAYWDGNNVQLEKQDWGSTFVSQTITSISNASPRVITFTTTHTFVATDLISVTGNTLAANNRLYRVISVTGTTATLGELTPVSTAAPGGVGTGGIAYLVSTTKTRAGSLLTNTNGVLHKFGDQTRKYVGTVLFDSDLNVRDATNFFGVYNYYNKLSRIVNFYDTAFASWSTGTTAFAWRPAGLHYGLRLWYVAGRDDVKINVDFTVAPSPGGAGTGAYLTTLGLGRVSGTPDFSKNYSRFTQYFNIPSTTSLSTLTNYNFYATSAVSYLQAMECLVSNVTSGYTVFMYFLSGTNVVYGGLTGEILI